MLTPQPERELQKLTVKAETPNITLLQPVTSRRRVCARKKCGRSGASWWAFAWCLCVILSMFSFKYWQMWHHPKKSPVFKSIISIIFCFSYCINVADGAFSNSEMLECFVVVFFPPTITRKTRAYVAGSVLFFKEPPAFFFSWEAEIVTHCNHKYKICTYVVMCVYLELYKSSNRNDHSKIR